MSDIPNEIAFALADALPRTATRRDEIIAVGILATALIATSAPDGRAELVEEFCAILRDSIRGEMN